MDQGQRLARSSPVLHFIRLPLWMSCGFWTTGPMFEIDLLRVCRVKRTAGVSSRSFTVTNKSKSLTCTVASSFVCASPLAVTTVVGFLEALTVSNSAEFRSFLLNMCVLAPESTTNCLPSGFMGDGSSKLHSLAGEKKVVLSVSLSFKMFLANLHASPRAHRSCLSISS